MSSRARSIVVGFDGSEVAGRALDAAADLAGYGSTLTVVSVRDGRVEPDRAIDAARERLRRRSILARYLEPIGDAADELVGAARDAGADLVVVGRRHRGLTQLVLGSVSAKVVRQAPCDVLVVR